MKLDPTEARILGALIEKGWTTPTAYPLTLNALIAACNQKSNRDPVLTLNEFEIEGCLMGMRMRGLIRQHERDTGRVARFEGLLGKELDLSRQEEALVAELLLRGPQTAPELVRRGARMATFSGPSEVESLLGGLAGRGLVRVLPRGSGQRHARWTEVMTGDLEAAAEAEAEPTAPAAAPVPAPTPAFAPAPAPATDPTPAPAAQVPEAPALAEEVAALRREVADLRTRVSDLEALI